MKNVLPSKVSYGHRFVDLIREAERVRQNAYEPYSRFMVGAAILSKRGNIYVGCNMENAVYNVLHAEVGALAAMVAAGERSPVMLAVVGGLEAPGSSQIIAPCLQCRQFLFEFVSLSGYEIDVVVADSDLADQGFISHKLCKLSDLPQDAFGPASIGIDLAKYRR